MFFEVRIFDARGELKKVVSPRRLSNRFWKYGGQDAVDSGEKENRSQDLENQKFLRDECQIGER